MYDGWLEIDGMEIVNELRATVYAAAHGLYLKCCNCPELADAIGDAPYIDPVTDCAPWYDPASPVSKGFLGVFPIGVTGLDDDPVERTPVNLVGDGASLGVLRRTHREIAYTVLLLAIGECELAYGLAWLARVLRGPCPDGDCQGYEICMFSCCPGDWPPDPTERDFGDASLRHLFNVGLLDGLSPAESAVNLSASVIGRTYTFTLAAGLPYIFGEPLPQLDEWINLAAGCTVKDLDPSDVYEDCKTPLPCGPDPDCPEPPLPPRPPVPVPDCYPTGAQDFLRSLVSLASDEYPLWATTVPVIEIETGATDLHRVVIRFWQSTIGADCEQMADPCNACFDITVPYLPAGSTLKIDGRSRTATLECRHIPGCDDAGSGGLLETPVLYGPEGDVWDWPVFDRPGGLCIEILAPTYTAADSRARVSIVPRWDAQ